ncbi:MAG: leucine-rich repeat domain-containing protein [Calditrichae bacterium]|nr:leucine-rich repeat domain-containing protein [Calditrichia bacterium]
MAARDRYKDVLERIKKTERNGDTELELTSLGLISLSPEIGRLTNLTKLELGFNQLTTLPPEIGQLTKLTLLHLNSNLFTTLSPEIGQLFKLKELVVNTNQLTTLPPEIGQLVNLAYLRLRRNQLTTLPPEIGRLTKLTQLALDDNRLIMLPPEIRQLTNLTELDLGNNQLTTLPPEIGQLTNLTDLYLGNNQLTTLPPEIGQLTKLTAKNLYNNPLRFPPVEIAQRDIAVIKAYFEGIENNETTQLFEAKLIIVGQGGVGKTYLLNRLIHDKIDEAAISTEGIDITKWVIKTKQSDSFQFNFWDFGGQEIYHATHQFFLTKRSLYLFLWEARTDADLLSFDYWLNTVRMLSNNSPVFVIQSKVDERSKDINQTKWKNLFNNIVSFHNVSAIAGTGINDLKTAIIREIEKLPHIGDVLPKRWMDIRERLEALTENYITYHKYVSICQDMGMDDQLIEILSEYYHDLGVCLHFKNNPVLRNTLYLNPEWATNAVYRVADSEIVKENAGKFHFNDLNKVWSNEVDFPADKHFELIELMKSFELCFELPGGREYIIPELLPAEQLKFDWEYDGNSCFKYQYEFMPAGIMTRFIVNAHDLIKENLFWKDGVVLTWEDNEALVINSDNRIIEVWLRGENRKTLLAMIRRHMDYIHSPFSNLKVDEMVRCICATCSNAKTPYFFSYDYLIKAKQKRKNTVDCQISLEEVLTESLLGEVILDKDIDKGLNHEKEVRIKRSVNAVPKVRTVKVFLASGSDLSKEREELKNLFYDETKNYILDSIFLDLIMWEDLNHSFHEDRIQNRFNDKLRECDIFISMFWKRVGKFTKEEFEAAHWSLMNHKNPKYLYVFFKDTRVRIDDIDDDIMNIKKFKKNILEWEQIYKPFKNVIELRSQIKQQLEIVIPQIVR